MSGACSDNTEAPTSSDIISAGMLEDLKTIETFIDSQHQHNNGTTATEQLSPSVGAPKTVAATPRDTFDEATVEPLRELCDELLVRSNALRQENESLVKEMSELKAELLLVRGDSRHLSVERDQTRTITVMKPSTTHASNDGSFGVQVDRLLSPADAQRAQHWLHNADVSHSHITPTLETKDGTLRITLVAAAKKAAPTTNTAAPRRPLSSGTVTTGTAAMTSSAAVIKVARPLGSSATNKGNVTAAAPHPQRSVTPVVTRPRATTPTRAPRAAPIAAPTAHVNSRAASPAISSGVVAAAGSGIGGLKSRSPTISRNSLASVAAAIKPRSTTPVAAVRSATPALRKASGGAPVPTVASSAIPATSATGINSTTFQQCGVVLRKGSAGISRRATGPPTTQKKSISASPQRDEESQGSTAPRAEDDEQPVTPAPAAAPLNDASIVACDAEAENDVAPSTPEPTHADVQKEEDAPSS